MGSPYDAPARPRVHALLAEDDPATASVLAHLLHRRGCAVQACSDGLQAADWLQRRSFDLLVVAANLPGISGLDLLRRFRAEEAGPVSIVTAWPGNDVLIARAFHEGAAEVLVRPFSLVEASARIGRLLTFEGARPV